MITNMFLLTCVIRDNGSMAHKFNSNNCVISIFPVLSKVLEKVLTVQLTDHLETNRLFHPTHFGFRCSTKTENCYFAETVMCLLDDDNVVSAVFFDLNMAFDTIYDSWLIVSKRQSV